MTNCVPSMMKISSLQDSCDKCYSKKAKTLYTKMLQFTYTTFKHNLQRPILNTSCALSKHAVCNHWQTESGQ